MDEISDVLSDLVPAWVALGAIAFGYLVYLFKKASSEFISLAHRQTDYLKDRIDVVDKTTVIFDRTIKQQEKEISNLTERLKGLSQHVGDAQDIAVEQASDEMRVLSQAITNLAKMQDTILQALQQQHPTADALEPPEVSVIRRQLEANVRGDIPRVIRSRDLTAYPVELTGLEGAPNLLGALRARGFAAKIYGDLLPEDQHLRAESFESIWLGTLVPTAVAVEVISIAIDHWPFLKYVELSTDGVEDPPDYTHLQIYLGGTTGTAIKRELRPWSEDDFARLRPDMSAEELHAHIRLFYGGPSPQAHD